MGFRLLLICATVATSLQPSLAALNTRLDTAATNGYDFVDPLIGSRNGGHVFAGATLPFGKYAGLSSILLKKIAAYVECVPADCL
ncbi:hypothetical protein GGS24DRAFT_482237 [Hypoxylon argillaceum]|nr:hypothetical protein GGS24DRAFT_482237 [Hypoxylon argillaceum]